MSKPYCAICSDTGNKKAITTYITVERLKDLFIWNIAMHVSI